MMVPGMMMVVVPPCMWVLVLVMRMIVSFHGFS